MFIRTGYLILILACWQASVVFAQTNDLRDCDMPSKNCLKFVADELQKVETHSMQWYSLKLMQFDSLMMIKEFRALKQELNAFDEPTQLPPMFVTHLNIYRAKLYRIDGNEQQALALLESSLEDLQQVNQAFYSPMRMVNIANLILNLEQYAQSLALLQQLETDFEKSKDPYLKMELYGNIAHAFRFLKKYDQALSYYKQSLPFAKKLGIEQQIVIVYEYIGSMYNETNQPELAESNFLKALSHAEKDARESTINHAKVNLAFFYIQQLELQKAEGVIKNIDPTKIESYQQKKWQAINDGLNKDNKN